jgi:hypothetical protein
MQVILSAAQAAALQIHSRRIAGQGGVQAEEVRQDGEKRRL